MAKFEDVLPSFRNGKKVQRKGWLYREEIEAGIAKDILADDWEIIEEPKKPMVYEGLCYAFIVPDPDPRIGMMSAWESFTRHNLRPNRNYRVTIEELP